jgi:hypothetical protein
MYATRAHEMMPSPKCHRSKRPDINIQKRSRRMKVTANDIDKIQIKYWLFRDHQLNYSNPLDAMFCIRFLKCLRCAAVWREK